MTHYRYLLYEEGISMAWNVALDSRETILRGERLQTGKWCLSASYVAGNSGGQKQGGWYGLREPFKYSITLHRTILIYLLGPRSE